VEGKVEVTELMGNEVQMYVLTGEHNFVARVDPRTSAKMGDNVQLVFNMGNMHLFDPESEQAVR
jgi:multiple sugar transport system ATP-binding protein